MTRASDGVVVVPRTVTRVGMLERINESRSHFRVRLEDGVVLPGHLVDDRLWRSVAQTLTDGVLARVEKACAESNQAIATVDFRGVRVDVGESKKRKVISVRRPDGSSTTATITEGG